MLTIACSLNPNFVSVSFYSVTACVLFANYLCNVHVIRLLTKSSVVFLLHLDLQHHVKNFGSIPLSPHGSVYNLTHSSCSTHTKWGSRDKQTANPLCASSFSSGYGQARARPQCRARLPQLPLQLPLQEARVWLAPTISRGTYEST